jgi:hypothetical protein
MSLSRHYRRQVRRAALALGCCVLIAPSAASAEKIGDTPADFGKPVLFAPKIGDTPADFPGASRTPQFEAPRTIQVVRPERTVVREVNEALPIVLSGAALFLALGGVGIALVRTRSARRGLAH